MFPKYLSVAMKWMSGIVFTCIGLVNILIGNDALFGVFIILLTLIFYPPIMRLWTKKSGIHVHWSLLLLLGAFILWASLGVGELPLKLHLLLRHFSLT